MMAPTSTRAAEKSFPGAKAFQVDVIKLVVEIKGPSMQGVRWLTDLTGSGTVTMQYGLSGKKITVTTIKEAAAVLAT